MFSAVLVIAMLLTVLSVPSIVLTARALDKRLKRYRAFRFASPEDIKGMEIPRVILDEWSSVSSSVTYATMLMDEIDRLNSLRPALFQAELAMALIIVLAIIPGFEMSVLVCMIFILASAAVSILYWHSDLRRYEREYYAVLSELESMGDDAESMIYG